MTEQPTGLVTFLFTDIEGSTKLWEQNPEAMKTALAKHDSLLRGVFIFHNGYVFKTVGDAFYGSFASTLDALNAAVHSQRELQKEFSGEILIKVRMALHCGEVETRDNDYFGQPLNRVSRLLSAGHGGQVLISTAVKERLGADLPQNISLRNMGEHKLKDVPTPMRIFQITAPDLRQEFPVLRTLSTLPNNLPAQVTSFVGREKEIEQVKEKIRTNRLVTLTGVGGTGKTRLSLQTASALQTEFHDGIWFVELAPVTEPGHIPQAVASALQLREIAERTTLEVITNFLRTRELLLLLDNCEHLLNSCGQLVDQLLRQCPKLKIIVTSREPLGVSGETIWSVPSLSTPSTNDLTSLETLMESESIKLFLDRARAAQPNFELNETNIHSVAQICTRLDGIPLALELAAARVRGMNVEQIASRLDNRFRLLTGGSRTALPRQQTLGALVDWSYNLLSATEQLLFQRLAVFIGSFNLESAEKVCSGGSIEEFDIFDLLQRLVDKSLVVIDERYGDNYYRLLETIRQYGRDKLLDSGNAEDRANRHAEYYEALAAIAFDKVRGPDQLRWLRKLGVMHDNLRSALGWIIDLAETKRTLQFVQNLSTFWFRRSELQESRQWFERALALTDVKDYPTDYILALAYHARGVWLQSGPSKAKPFVMEALSLARACGEKNPLAEALLIQCLVAAVEHDFEQGNIAGLEAKLLFQELNDEWGCAHALLALALCSSHKADPTEALSLYREALALFEKQGDIFFQNVAQRWIGVHEIDLGNRAYGLAAIHKSLQTSHLLESKNEVMQNLWVLADAEMGAAKYTRAIRLYFAAKMLAANMGSWDAADEETLREKISSARNILDEVTFNAVCDQGAAMTMEQAIEYALGVEHE